MEYRATQKVRTDDLASLLLAIKQETGDNLAMRQRLIEKKITAMVDDKTWNPKEFNPFVVARVVIPDFDQHVNLSSNTEEVQFALNSSDFDNILHTVLSKIAMDEFNYRGAELLELCSQGDAISSDYEDIPALTPIDELRQRLPNEDFEEGGYSAYKARCPMYDKGIIIRLGQELLWDASKFADVVSRAEKLGESTATVIGKAVSQTIEMGSSRKVFEKSEHSQNLAFKLDGTSYQSSFYHVSSHSSIDGQTNPNIVNAATAYTWAGLNNCYQLLAAMKDQEGKAVNIGMPFGLFPSIYEHTVTQLLTTPQVIGSGNNDLNTFRGTIKPYFTPFLSSNTYYYVGDFPKALKWRWVEKPSLVRNMDPAETLRRRAVAAYRWSMYFGLCWTDYRFAVKSGTS